MYVEIKELEQGLNEWDYERMKSNVACGYIHSALFQLFFFSFFWPVNNQSFLHHLHYFSDMPAFDFIFS